MLETAKLAHSIARIIDSKKARDIKILDLRELTDSFEFFVICSCNNAKQLDAIIDEVENVLRDNYGERPYLIEGRKDGYWALLDFGGVILHIFQEEAREYYRLEQLWGDAKTEEFQGEGQEQDCTA